MAKPEPVYDVEAGKFLAAVAGELKKLTEFAAPEWAYFVKTSSSKERIPDNQEWWFTRAASILRQLYVRKVVGVNRMRNKYGSNKNRGVKPKRFAKGSGKNIRVILQQAEAAGFVEKVNGKLKGKRSGRKLTQKGKDFLETVAQSLK